MWTTCVCWEPYVFSQSNVYENHTTQAYRQWQQCADQGRFACSILSHPMNNKIQILIKTNTFGSRFRSGGKHGTAHHTHVVPPGFMPVTLLRADKFIEGYHATDVPVMHESCSSRYYQICGPTCKHLYQDHHFH